MELKMIPINKIKPNPFQPRETFEEQSLKELADSIKDGNVIQPIIVRKYDESYQIIAGERRWRAAQIAGIKELPCVVKDLDEAKVLLESLIENLHRKDLTDIERENAVYELWMKRETLGINSKADLAKTLGVTETKVQDDIEAWEFRHREVGIPTSTPTYIISRTQGLPVEERKKVIEKVQKGEFQAQEAYTAIKLLRKAPEPIKRELLMPKSHVTPKMAETILEKIPEQRKQSLVLEEIKQFRLTEEEVENRVRELQHEGGIGKHLEELKVEHAEIPLPSLSEQIHDRVMWNLERIDFSSYTFFTIGYSERDIKQFIDVLKKANVKTLIDARAEPSSMYKPDFNKANLQRILEMSGIRYTHYAELGVPKDIRLRLTRSGDWDWFFKWYDTNVIPRLEELNLQALQPPIAIMCVELDPTRCHRHRIALALEKRGLKGLDL